MAEARDGVSPMDDELSCGQFGLEAQVSEVAHLRALLVDREKRLSKAYSKIHALEDRMREIDEARQETQVLRNELDARFREIAILTRLLEQDGSVGGTTVPESGRRLIVRRVLGRILMLFRGGGGGLRADVALVRRSGLFDDTWYLQRYPDVANSGMDPLEHYLLHGASEGRNPSPAFSTTDYVSSHPEIKDSNNKNPLIHFIRENKVG